jgi:hypothetical protein
MKISEPNPGIGWHEDLINMNIGQGLQANKNLGENFSNSHCQIAIRDDRRANSFGFEVPEIIFCRIVGFHPVFIDEFLNIFLLIHLTSLMHFFIRRLDPLVRSGYIEL